MSFKTYLRLSVGLGTSLICAACSPDAISISMEATDTVAPIFAAAKDMERIERDRVASKRLGQLSFGVNHLTVEELAPLKKAVADAKADGKVTFEEADRILLEMERAAALRPANQK